MEEPEPNQKKLKYPRAIPFIVLSEFCERFTFFGHRAILVLYLVKKLNFEENEATMIYHTFLFLNYFFSLFGGILAESFIGQFLTISLLSTVFATGSLIITIGSIEPWNFPSITLTFLGLFLIAVGSGGIKTCVSSFGADQFKLPEQETLLSRYFSIFYFFTNIGSLLSMGITPLLRKKIHCFDQSDCFFAAFLLPAALMFISIIVFVSGKFMYRVDAPSQKVVFKMIACIATAIITRKREKYSNPKDHWLDYAETKYGKKRVQETKMFLRILLLFVPLPIFWALFDQQGSRWTIQASKMNHKLGKFNLEPDQMQILNPLLILILVPIWDVFNPLLRCYHMYKPLRTMVLGGIFTSLAFFLSYIVQIQIDSSPEKINILWQIPQYFLITFAEITFCVTGLAFSFQESPVKMRNLVSAAWLVTVAVGNVITTIVVSGRIKYQSTEFLAFAGLMFLNMIVFIILAYNYQHVTVSELMD